MDILGEICRILKEDSKTADGDLLIDEAPIVEFQQYVKNMRAEAAAILEENRMLHLGIVGEVKAGKSSFLNAILFNGEDVLPKAPTPMTAALTKLSYSSTPEAKIVFYTEDDWRGIERMAQRYDEKLDSMYQKYCQDFQNRQMQAGLGQRIGDLGRNFLTAQPDSSEAPAMRMKSKEEYESLHKQEISAEWAACKEVLEMARKQGIGIKECLGFEKTIQQTGSNNDYLKRLGDYVGSKGRYTPLVKYTEIQLDNPMLKGVEVIDTPGLNDPVISRTRTTQNFLMQCDAIFLLSYCGQFLGEEDIHFIMSVLPREGINKAVLIGSKFDSAILQYPKKNATFKQSYLGTKRNCENQAEVNIAACQNTMQGNKVLEQIRESLPPMCTSSMAFSIATKRQNNLPLNEEEQHMLTQFSKRFSDFQANLLMGMSSIPDAREKAFDETKAQKTQIIKERTQSFLTSQRTRLLGDLKKIYNRVSTSKSDLESFDCAQDEELLRKMKQRLASVQVEVKGIFSKAATDAQWTVKETVLEALDEMNNHLKIEVAKATKTEHHTSTKGLIFKRTEHWDEIITTNTAEVRDAEANLRSYNTQCLRIINNRFRHMINKDGSGGLNDRIKSAFMRAFDQHNQDFDEHRILDPVDQALDKIILPDIALPMDKYTELLDEKLTGIVSNGVVKNEDIPELKRAQDQVLSVMAEDIKKKVEQQGRDISDRLAEQASVFVDNITGELEGNHKRLESQIKDKKENLQRYDKLLQKLRDARKALQEADLGSIVQDGQQAGEKVNYGSV